jgi:hypothetical protein
MKTLFFDTIKLEEMDQVKLMNRTDTKYWFHYDFLQGLLLSIHDDYYILTIDNDSEMPYLTTYFDTKDNKMFAAHHNGKLNGYKVRRRTYLSSNISFLEVKFKSNKGRTIKNRIITKPNESLTLENESTFLSKFSPFNACELQPVLVNKFTRLMLVNKNFKERCTIDFNIQFEYNNQTLPLDGLVIVELKSDGGVAGSPLAKALSKKRIKSSGFSKYCVGRTVTDTQLKRNGFKAKIRSIEKTIDSKLSLYHN